MYISWLKYQTILHKQKSLSLRIFPHSPKNLSSQESFNLSLDIEVNMTPHEEQKKSWWEIKKQKKSNLSRVKKSTIINFLLPHRNWMEIIWHSGLLEIMTCAAPFCLNQDFERRFFFFIGQLIMKLKNKEWRRKELEICYYLFNDSYLSWGKIEVEFDVFACQKQS